MDTIFEDSDELPTHVVIEPDMCPRLEEARKDIDFGTDDIYNPDDTQHISEWAMSLAVSRFKLGDIVPMEEFQRQCMLCKQEQMLMDLCDRGLMETYFDGTGMAYRVTAAGAAHVEAQKRG